jgi:signal transduction histidine kinase
MQSAAATLHDTPQPAPAQVQLALEQFTAAGARIESFYRHLSGEVRRLSGDLESSNLALRRNLAEKEKMQAILVSTLQSLTVGALAVGQDGVVIVANPAICRILDRPVQQLATRRIDEVLAGIPQGDQLMLTLQGAGGAQSSLTWFKELPARAPRHVELTAARALPPYDLHLAGVILAEDQTRMRELEQQAALRSRLTGMGEIAMNLAHEIRNPLGSISLFATALEHELDGNGELKPLASQIVSGVKALEHLVANTLEFARPRRMAMARVNLTRVLSDALVYVEHPLMQKNIRVEFHPDLSPEVWIAGDTEQLRQVFLNLLLNAVQAMEEDGCLSIRIGAAENGGWEVAIADDGVGIPEEMLDRIFDPFFTTKEKGSGIGLAVVHTILAAHGARISVRSRVAAGTTFRVVFPAKHDLED